MAKYESDFHMMKREDLKWSLLASELRQNGV